MGSGDWFKNIIHSKKKKNSKSKSQKVSSAPQDSNELDKDLSFQKETITLANTNDNGHPATLPILDEDIAATRIQCAFRAYRARKIHRHLKGTVRLRRLTLGSSVKKQASTTLSHLHTWSKIQAEIRARRISMATEARIRQKKLESQLKLEAKLHDLEVEWNGGPEMMDEVVARIHLREEAAVKRERAMAYAFSHQWRANSNNVLGNYELGKAIWGWSWMERWIAARPWESRALVVQSTPKKAANKQLLKNTKNTKSPTTKSVNSIKSISPNANRTKMVRKLSYGAADQEAKTKKELILSH